MIVGCYGMDLYCDHPRHPTEHQTASHSRWAWALYGNFTPAQFTGHTEADCVRDARKAGWTFKKTPEGRNCHCPECSEGRFIA